MRGTNYNVEVEEGSFLSTLFLMDRLWADWFV